ncbi:MULTISPECIES: hypothetical protein [Chromohalobacter]|uniref:hypothetical protein n=1 Tax=Chromohalobacter TaxID=42054 RepID=UPI00240ECA28|nr:hypothetical protein [Chromohalobacter canadensis]
MNAHLKAAKTRLRHQLHAELRTSQLALRHLAHTLEEECRIGRHIDIAATRGHIELIQEIADNLDNVGHSLSEKGDK